MNFTRTRQFVTRYERILSVVATALGFLADNLLLGRADELPGKLLLYFYFVSAGILILLIHSAEEGVWKGSWQALLGPWLPLALQFIFGSTFSAFLVFYSHAASLSVSWIFLLILFAVFAGTEIFKHYQDRLVYQCALYFFSLFSFCVYYVPLLVGSIGTGVFLASGAASVLLFLLFAVVLYFTGRTRFSANLRRIVFVAGAVYAGMNFLYFAHVLPPLPLSLKDIGAYHSVVRTDTGYQVSGESLPWLQGFFGTYDVHIKAGDAVYVFSSVFTPIAIQTDLVHRWEYWDDAKRQWITAGVIRFPVSGGRDGGYRGFSEIQGIAEGKWRVSVETPGQALIGRIGFTVSYTEEEPPLAQGVL